jgi:hypothetical protein
MIKKLTTSIMMLTVAFGGYAFLEPSTVGAATDTDQIIVNLTVDDGISITSPADVNMSTMGISANTSTGWAVWNVKTNAPAGYELDVIASATPAMQSGSDSFADYTEATPGDPDTFAVDAGEFEFGFSALGVDVENVGSDKYGASGQTVCDDGSSSSTVNTNLNFEGFEGATNKIIASRAATTTTDGVDTRICFAAGQNGVFTPAGSYSATITATATTL